MKKKVLIIDDETDILKTVKTGLETIDENFEVIGLESGKDCIKYLSTKKDLPDIILIDIMMPEMDGWQLLNRIKEKNKYNKIPLIFLTAKNDDFTKTFGKTQTDDFIEKPFDIEDLRLRIDNAIRKSKKDFLSLE